MSIEGIERFFIDMFWVGVLGAYIGCWLRGDFDNDKNTTNVCKKSKKH